MLQIRHIILLGALSLCSGPAYCQSSFLLDVYSAVPPVLYSATTTNGAHLYLVNTPTGRVLWRGDANGDPLWAKEIPADPSMIKVAPDANDGAYVVGASYTMTSSAPGIGDDTLVEYLTVRALHGDGTLNWSRDVELMSVLPYEATITLENISTMLLPDGGIAVALYLPAQTYFDLLHIYRFSPDGDLVSTKAYGTQQWPPYPAGLVPGAAFDISDPQWTMADNGWSYFLFKQPGVNLPRAVVYGFDGTGDMAWGRQFTYVNSFALSDVCDASVSSSGDLLFGFAGAAAGSPTVLTIRASSNGEISDHDLYQGWTEVGSAGFSAGLNDGVVMHTNSNGDSYLVEADAAGGTLNAWHAPNFDAAPYAYRVIPTWAAPSSNSVNTHVTLRRQHQVFGYVDHFAGSMVVSPSDPGCLFQPTLLNHYQIPDSLVDTDTLQVAASFDLQPTVNVGTDLVDAVLFGTHDPCSILMGIAENNDQAFTVINTVANPGIPIGISTQRPLRIELIGLNSELASEPVIIPRAGTTHVPVSQLATGVYVLRAFEMDGNLAGSARIVVE